MQDFIPLSIPKLKGNELKYVSEAITSEWVSTGGAFITRFEKEFSAYAKVKDAVAVQSGTAALHLAMIACGVSAGDLVAAPALTFVAAVNPARYLGADPVFMDCDDSLCMDPLKLAKYLGEECELRDGRVFDKTLNRQVKAILVVHVFGNAADMESLVGIADHYGLPVIEDATEAVGTFFSAGQYSGRMAGAIGDYGAYSFNGNKIITTGGGGMLMARSRERLEYMRHLSTQAKTDDMYYDHDEIGFNYRMTNLQAALGIAQLEQLETFIEIKRGNYYCYKTQGVLLQKFRENTRPNYWFYAHPSGDRDGLIKALLENQIQARPIWKLIHTLPMYKQCRAYEIEKAQAYYSSIVNLPCGSGLSEEEVNRVAETVRSFEKGKG